MIAGDHRKIAFLFFCRFETLLHVLQSKLNIVFSMHDRDAARRCIASEKAMIEIIPMIQYEIGIKTGFQ